MNNFVTINETTVIAKTFVGQKTFLLTLKTPPKTNWAALGRFAKLRCWNSPHWQKAPFDHGPLLDRPFSIGQVNSRELSFLIRINGPASFYLSELSPGQTVQISGPLGRGLDDLSPQSRNSPYYLVAGGVGLAPMASLGLWLSPSSRLFYGEKTAANQVEQNWLSSWSNNYSACTDDGSGYGSKALVTKLLEKALIVEKRPVFACGPAPMLASVTSLAKIHNVPVWVATEAFMACGFGVCLSCSQPLISGKKIKICRDGPVVDGLTLNWKEIL